MSTSTLNLTPELRDYLLRTSVREHEVLAALREETAKRPDSRLQIAPEQGALMALLVQLIDARRVIEIGTFTGYSSLAMALALPEDGRLVTCDRSEENTSVARRYWDRAGVAHKIQLRIGPALDTVDAMIDAGETETYDFGFIDADKESDLQYFELLLRLLRPGGLIAVDNVLWSGRVIDPGNDDPDTVAIREFNDMVGRDERVSLAMIPIADGLTLAMKRSKE